MGRALAAWRLLCCVALGAVRASCESARCDLGGIALCSDSARDGRAADVLALDDASNDAQGGRDISLLHVAAKSLQRRPRPGAAAAAPAVVTPLSVGGGAGHGLADPGAPVADAAAAASGLAPPARGAAWLLQHWHELGQKGRDQPKLGVAVAALIGVAVACSAMLCLSYNWERRDWASAFSDAGESTTSGTSKSRGLRRTASSASSASTASTSKQARPGTYSFRSLVARAPATSRRAQTGPVFL
mmetsp:Transcript_86039/g.240751  ORF Transcript_86039/g.240751 Transcript_86039/m.240751 type:complete len:245 (-) Transcript_86039:67-801(-)